MRTSSASSPAVVTRVDRHPQRVDPYPPISAPFRSRGGTRRPVPRDLKPLSYGLGRCDRTSHRGSTHQVRTVRVPDDFGKSSIVLARAFVVSGKIDLLLS